MAGAGMRRNQIGGTDGLVSHAEPGARLRRFSVPAAYTPPCAAQFRCANVDLYQQQVRRMPHRMRGCGPWLMKRVVVLIQTPCRDAFFIRPGCRETDRTHTGLEFADDLRTIESRPRRGTANSPTT